MSASKNAETNLFEQQQSFDFGPPRPFVRPALPAERRSVLEVIGRAFHDDPVTCHLFPKEHKRTIRWARFSGLAIKSMGDTAHVLTTDSVQGAAVWQFPVPTCTLYQLAGDTLYPVPTCTLYQHG